jgi:ABC-type nitrate/sulfonate/bicarbonate transport system ATPase subunit
VSEKLRADNVGKSYLGSKVIDGVSISVGEGELVSLLGVSGVGKTTLFNIINGLTVPDEGSVFLGEEDVTGRSGKIGYMLQKDLLLPYKKIIDNVSLPLVIRGDSKAAAREKALEYFPAFSLEGCQMKYPHQLSGGMRQRAALLRTFLFGRAVILLDEPFSALDAITRSQMRQWFLKIVKEFSVSAFFITHDLDEAILLSDTVYLMTGSPGRISEKITILPGRGDRDAFAESPEFAGYRRRILKGIGL